RTRRAADGAPLARHRAGRCRGTRARRLSPLDAARAGRIAAGPRPRRLHRAFARVTLGPAVVEVWRAELDRARFESLITAAERERARRFRSDAARDRWIAGRGALRELLGRYLDRNPEEIVLATEPGGKPALAGSPSLQFNLSHSQGTAV